MGFSNGPKVPFFGAEDGCTLAIFTKRDKSRLWFGTSPPIRKLRACDGNNGFSTTVLVVFVDFFLPPLDFGMLYIDSFSLLNLSRRLCGT